MDRSLNDFSFLKGFSFLFEDGPHTIECWFSSFSGSEKVKVNDNLLASQRNLSTNSGNGFELDGSSYRTNLEVKNILKGPYICSLIKNEKLLKQQELIFPGLEESMPWYRTTWFFFLSGLFLGIVYCYYKYPFWIGIAILAALSIFSYKKRTSKKPFIREINVDEI